MRAWGEDKIAKQRATAAVLAGALFFVMGCATYQGKVSEARSKLTGRQNDQAIELLKPLAEQEGKDQLIYLLDLASTLQSSGQYEESSKYFQRADQMTDLKDYISISKQAASLFLSEEMTQYKGEDFERLLINVFAALNYVMLRDRDSALVEVRRLNDKLNYFRVEEKKEYGQNPAASYFSAMLWEADKNFDSAYIDYERAYKQNPSIPGIREDLIRLSKIASRPDLFEKWTKEFKIKFKSEWSDKKMGEIVLIYQQGWGPRKAERPRVLTAAGFVSPGFPMLVPVSTFTKRAHLKIFRNSGGAGPAALPESPDFGSVTGPVYDVESNAIRTLEEAYAPLIAKRIAAWVAKELAANQISKKNEGLGAIMGLAMHLADRADLRQWSFLPQTIQVARVQLPAGKYTVAVDGLSAAGTTTDEMRDPEVVEVKPGQKIFLDWRSFR